MPSRMMLYNSPQLQLLLLLALLCWLTRHTTAQVSTFPQTTLEECGYPLVFSIDNITQEIVFPESVTREEWLNVAPPEYSTDINSVQWIQTKNTDIFRSEFLPGQYDMCDCWARCASLGARLPCVSTLANYEETRRDSCGKTRYVDLIKLFQEDAPQSLNYHTLSQDTEVSSCPSLTSNHSVEFGPPIFSPGEPNGGLFERCATTRDQELGNDLPCDIDLECSCEVSRAELEPMFEDFQYIPLFVRPAWHDTMYGVVLALVYVHFLSLLCTCIGLACLDLGNHRVMWRARLVKKFSFFRGYAKGSLLLMVILFPNILGIAMLYVYADYFANVESYVCLLDEASLFQASKEDVKATADVFLWVYIATVVVYLVVVFVLMPRVTEAEVRAEWLVADRAAAARERELVTRRRVAAEARAKANKVRRERMEADWAATARQRALVARRGVEKRIVADRAAAARDVARRRVAGEAKAKANALIIKKRLEGLSVAPKPLTIHRLASTNENVLRHMVREEDQAVEMQRQKFVGKVADGNDQKTSTLIECPHCNGHCTYEFEVDVELPQQSPAADDTPPTYETALQHATSTRPQLLDRSNTFTRSIACSFCSGSGQIDVWAPSLNAPADEDLYPCGICYDVSQYGISTDCAHFFCKECIVSSLEAMLDVGEFPAFCPVCKAEASVDNKEPEHGRISQRALSFLQQRKVIDTEFYFRFLRLQLRQEEKAITFFPCPRACGKYLKSRPVELSATAIVTKQGKGYKSIRAQVYGLCSCGVQVCMRCMKEPVTDDNLAEVVFRAVTHLGLLSAGMKLQAYSDLTKQWENASVVRLQDKFVYVDYLDQRAFNVDGKTVVPGSTEADCKRTIAHLQMPAADVSHELTCTALQEPEEAKMDAKTKALLQGHMFKPCPNCGMFMQKNGGCNIVLCGANAHGKMSEALRNGGCGYMFNWDTGKPARCQFTLDVTVV